MFYDGLQDPYSGEMMGHFAQVTADKYGFSRDEMDAFAIESVNRAQRAVADGTFADEIAPVTISRAVAMSRSSRMRHPDWSASTRFRSSRPAFRKDGTVTAATSSSISDGAAAVVMMTRRKHRTGLAADRENRRPLGVCA